MFINKTCINYSMKADVFTEKDRKIIRSLLNLFPLLSFCKYYCKGDILWHVFGGSFYFENNSYIQSTFNKLEKLGIVISDMSEQEYRIQFALGTIKNWEFYIPTKSREILEKLYEDYA